ncbi:hypothetical protein [Peijinzhouia sedimentorum]|tara:strand:- start:1234 stop:1623 length:390 start_codon:yes stop_codon:yes gene_type:complete
MVKKALFKIIGYSAFLAAIIFLLQNISFTHHLIHSDIWTIFIFSFIVSILIGLANSYFVSRKDFAENLPQVFIASTVMRLLLSIFFVGIVLYLGVEDRLLWVINFFILYIFYLIFEIISLMTTLRPHSR